MPGLYLIRTLLKIWRSNKGEKLGKRCELKTFAERWPPMVSRWFRFLGWLQLIPSRLINIIYYHRSVIISFKLLEAWQAREQRSRTPIIYNYPRIQPLLRRLLAFYSRLMDARQTSGVNFSFNAFHPSLALISPTLQRAPLCPVGEANFNASEKGQTWPYYFALPLCACPRNATGHYHFPPLSSPFITSPMNPIPRCTGLPYPKSSNWKLEQASRDSRSRGESFER